MRRQRLTWDKTAARAPSGLYGYTKKIQADCETCVRKLDRHATSLVKTAYGKDERIVAFLQTHAKRAKSSSARVLLSALKASAPKIAGKGGKVAASKTYGLYGFPSNTVKLGLAMCSQLREQAGLLTANLHARRVAKHPGITGFFRDHSKKTRSYSARMLLAGYPDADAKYASGQGKTAGGGGIMQDVDVRAWYVVTEWSDTFGPFRSQRDAQQALAAAGDKGEVWPGSQLMEDALDGQVEISPTRDLRASKTAAGMVTAGVDSWLAWDDSDDDLSHYG